MRNDGYTSLSMRAARRRVAGLVLIEVLVAIVILAIVTAMIYESFAGVVETTSLARENAESLRFRQYLWRNFANTLPCVYTDPGCEAPEYRLYGEDSEGAFGPADMLRFCTSQPVSGPNALPGVLRVVTYEVVDASEAEGESALSTMAVDQSASEAMDHAVLIIREEPLVLESLEFETNSEMVASSEPQEQQIPIRSFDVEFYDYESEEWVKDWDSQEKGFMPWALRVKVNFARTEDQLQAEMADGADFNEYPDLDMTVPLPVGAGVENTWLDLNHRRPSDSLEEDDGLMGERVNIDRSKSKSKEKHR